MMRVRLLPVLVFGLVSLLSLKLLQMALNAPPQSSFQPREANGSSFSRTITIAREGNPDDQIITGAISKKKEDPAKTDEAAKKDGERLAINGKALTEDQAAVEKAKADLKAKAEPEGTRIIVPQNPGSQVAQAGPSAEERALLEKLRNRRDEIDTKDRDLEMRDNLLRMSERKLDERIGELRTLETQLGQSQTKNDAKTRYKPLVVMYESMKPKEAARVFDRLDTRILMDMVAHMNPRKVSEILAVMEPSAAEKLTIALARQAQLGDAQLAETAQAPSTELERLPTPNAPRR
jgi:flagellar motility protein MotE (MotC chaperone)